MAAGEEKYCEVCKRTHNLKEFYSSNNLEKYPDGKVNICKKMITMDVDNWNPETFLPILQECDVPYIPKIWNNKLATYGKDRSKVSGLTIIGRYLSTMRIKPNDKWRWKDTQYLQELADRETEEAMKRQGYDAQEIDKVVRENRKTVPEEGKIYELNVSNAGNNVSDLGSSVYSQQDYFAAQSGAEEDNAIVDELTDEDKRYLRLKWGKAYKPEEWVRLEQLYEEMQNSYDIQGAGHEDILKLVCKTSLKANQLLDIGDVDGAQKMVKMYDGLMKSGKFTAAQNKAENGEYLDSISELVVICEKQGFIPRYYTDGPKDRVDETIQDLKEYTHSLVVEEMNLGNLIENAVKQMAMEEAKEEDIDDEDEELTFEQLEALKDENFEEFYDMIEEGLEEDERQIQGEIKYGFAKSTRP